jgi:hypothetical protein
MRLADALTYTHKAGYALPSGGCVTVWHEFREGVQLHIRIRRGAAGESEWHFANTLADVPVTIAMQGIHVPPDAWEHRLYVGSTTAPHSIDRLEIINAVAAGQVPRFFADLLSDATHAGILRVKECAEIARTGAVAACLPPVVSA